MAINQEILDKLNNRKYVNTAEVAEVLMDMLNGSGSGAEAFAEVVTGEHRFLQGEAFTMFLFCIEKWAKNGKDGCYDDRNKAACEFSMVMRDALKEKGLW